MNNFVFACLGIREIKIDAKMFLCPHLKNLKSPFQKKFPV